MQQLGAKSKKRDLLRNNIVRQRPLDIIVEHRLEFDDRREAGLDRLQHAADASAIRAAVSRDHETDVRVVAVAVEELHGGGLRRGRTLAKVVEEHHDALLLGGRLGDAPERAEREMLAAPLDHERDAVQIGRVGDGYVDREHLGADLGASGGGDGGLAYAGRSGDQHILSRREAGGEKLRELFRADGDVGAHGMLSPLLSVP